MQKLSVTAEDAARESPATLGDVLYAKSGVPTPEQYWARLVQRLAAGDQLALHELYQRAHRLVFTLAMRITANRETAEELTIDVFYDVWRRAATYDPANGTVLGWVMNQARSRAIDRVRFETRKKRVNGGEPIAQEESVNGPDVIGQREQGRALRAAVAQLAPHEREAIETAFFKGLTHAEAAAHLDQPLGTIKTRIRSALQKLRDALGTLESA